MTAEWPMSNHHRFIQNEGICMSKIRTVKPELFRHEQLFEAEQQSGFPLRLLFIGLFTVVDAEGRFRWRPRQLKLDILPYDEINFSAALICVSRFWFCATL